MPFGPGTYGPGGGGLAAPARDRQGIPQGGVVDTQPNPEEVLSEVIQMLRGGQAGAERFMELLGLLAGASLPNLNPQAQSQPQPEGPAPAGGVDLATLLGGR
jgi:hypothetical protein